MTDIKRYEKQKKRKEELEKQKELERPPSPKRIVDEETQKLRKEMREQDSSLHCIHFLIHIHALTYDLERLEAILRKRGTITDRTSNRRVCIARFFNI